MDERSVVTCFLRNDGEVLLLRRSADATSYPGRWGTVTGYLTPEREADPEPPETAAHREIAEETGLGDAVTLAEASETFRVEDPDGGWAWTVHPFLFDCEYRDVDLNAESSGHEWVHAPEIRRRETVPDLWGSYDCVRPTVETVATDSTHGAAWISLRALEVLRDEAALAVETDDWDHVAAVARELADARPSMTAVANRVNRAMDAADRTPAAVERAARETLESAVAADANAAAVAAEAVAGRRIATLSRSGTVRVAIEKADPEAVLVAESRPGGEGVGVAESLAEQYDVTLTSDAALAGQIAEWGAEAVLVGADTVLPDGSVSNKVGTRAAALAAAHEEIPCYAVAATDKISPDVAAAGEMAHEPIYEGDAPLTVANPLFESTPAALFAGVCTEDGVLDGEAVARVASEHRSRRSW